MKALFAGIVISLTGSMSLASTIDSVGCFPSVLDEARKVYGRFQDTQRIYPLQYEGSKVVIYKARLEQNGGRMEIESVVEKEACKVLKIYTVWAD